PDPRVTVEAPPPPPPAGTEGQLTPLGPALPEDPVPLRPDLFLGPGDDAAGLLLRPPGQVLAPRLGGLAGLLDDPVGVLPGSRELLAVVGQELVGVAAGLLGLLEVALDLRPASFQRLAQAGQHPLRHEQEQYAERDGSAAQLRALRVQVLLVAHWVG